MLTRMFHTITPTAAQRKCECHTDHWLIFPSLGPAKRIGFEFISFSYEICITQQFYVSKLKLCSSTMFKRSMETGRQSNTWNISYDARNSLKS
jgi:hypothetical protein